MFARRAAHAKSLLSPRFAFCLLLAPVVFPCITSGAQSAQNDNDAAHAVPSATAQSSSTKSSAGTGQQSISSASQEVSTREPTTPFSVRVNLVPIRVVVRDSKGHAVTDLRQEDFKVFEDGKPQIISHFSVENRPAAAQKTLEPPPTYGGDPEKESSEPLVRPTRFVALLFDDIHLPFGDLARIRNVADEYVTESFAPTDRFAVFTISGRSQTDFTDDRAKLHEALMGIQPRPVTAGEATGNGECPPIDYFQADLIVNQHDLKATDLAVEDTLVCEFSSNTQFLTAAQGIAQSTALHILATGDIQTQYSFQRLKEVVKRMSVVTGQRLIVLMSPGFLMPKQEWQMSEIIDNAVRQNVAIGTLDARGLYTVDPLPDVSAKPTGDPSYMYLHTSYRFQAQTQQSDVLYSLAAGTGGGRFGNSNDLSAGFRELVAAPEASYLIGFVPQNLKYDGHFHSLKVELNTKAKYSIQARSGFFAPKHMESPTDAVKQEIEEAVLSQEEQHGLPIQLHTQYYKTGPAGAKLAVLTHVDIGRIRFDKLDGRNKNDLTIVAALFDRNGNFVTATEKVLEMRLRDATLEKLSHTGVTVRTSFDVKPGAYIVRLVVRDSQAAQLSAENGVVEIPY